MARRTGPVSATGVRVEVFDHEEITMYARVARFEGGTADGLRRAGEETSARAQTGPPEGVDSVGFLMLIDPESGTSLGIGLFETEEKLRQSEAALNAMSPPPDGSGGRRTSVDVYEVAVDIRM
jgi:hypothetical protein